MTAIVARELRLLFYSSTGTALLAAWALCVGVLFLVDLTAFEQAEQRALALGDPALVALLDVNDLLLSSVLKNVVVLFLFLAPLLAMRLFADEESTRDWLLHASDPGTVGVGKTIAGIVVVVGLSASTLALPALLAAVGQPATGAAGPIIDVAQTLLATSTVAACAASFVALACAIAAVVDVPLAGGLLAFVVLVLWWFLPSAESFVGVSLGRWLSWGSPSSHLESGLRGLLHGGDLLWFATTILAATAATILAVGRGRR
jgi:ABC-2 type transport system permease protein